MKKASLVFVLLCILFSGHVFAQSNPPTDITPSVTVNTQSVTPCSSTDSSNCYQLLEQLPTGDPNKPLTNVDITTTEKDKGIGGFINFIVEIGIGVAGVLGVVMLTIYGFQYAAEDKNVATFETLKTRITSVILGLLLLLGTFIILKTINPDLLIVSPTIQTQYLDNSQIGDTMDPSSFASGIPPPDAQSLACPAGMVGVQGIYVCKNISTKVDQLLTAAKLAGISLNGLGWRGPQTQITLRDSHCGCGGNMSCIYTKPPNQCTPPTGIPGRSRHEAGLAIDFTCNGSTMSAGSMCFNWMQGNAAKYGLYNLSSESWHWSIDGH